MTDPHRPPDLLLDLEPGDEITITIDRLVLTGTVQNPPRRRNPSTIDDWSEGWQERATLPHVTIIDSDGTSYEYLDLIVDKRGGEWKSLSARAYRYDEDDAKYVHDPVETVTISREART